MRLFKIFIFFICFFVLKVKAQKYDENYVSMMTTSWGQSRAGIVEMSRKNNHVKVKYFAGRDVNGRSVYDRFKEWSANKNIIAYASGGNYTTSSWNLQTSRPVGFCMDNGDLVNNTYEKDQFDGLAIVYATGGIVVNNIKNGDLRITLADGTSRMINPRRQLDRNDLIDWGRRNGLTIFQTHLLYYSDEMLIDSASSSPKMAPRRFLAVGTDKDDVIHHYLINFSDNIDLYRGTKKAAEFLKIRQEVKSIKSIINLETGGGDIFRCFNPDGSVREQPAFSGSIALESAVNLLVYYYE